MLRQMFYPKNVPNWERVIRIIVGAALVALALSNAVSPILAGLLLASAAFIAITGFVGWCPACALVGRKIKVNSRRTP